MLGINVWSLVKTELLKAKDKAGDPEVLDVLNALEHTLVVIEHAVSKVTAADVEEAFTYLPGNFRAKFTPAEVTALATAIANLPAELEEADKAVLQLETELKKK